MITKIDKNKDRSRRHTRVRTKIFGTAAVPRLNVYRSLNHTYVQIIDDEAGHTLASYSTLTKEISKKAKSLSKKEEAKMVGIEIGKIALAKGIKQVTFDRGGYLYTGRVQMVADGAREAGLKL